MTRRSKYSDIKSLGKSKLVPFRRVEDASDRHYRRLKQNLCWQNSLRKWAEQNKYDISIKNKGHHWILIRDQIRIEWWPSSAKLVINQEWLNGIHCHDYTQLIQYIERNYH